MEDVHTYVANFAERLDWGYFAIFDGHAGKQAARWCGNNLHNLIEQAIVTQESENKQKLEKNHDFRDTLNDSFIKADELINEEGSGNSGCTAAVVVLVWESSEESNLNDPNDLNDNDKSKNIDTCLDYIIQKHRRMLYTANVGDLRIILFRNGQAYRLTYDHKASDINEINRIRENGGLIMKNRVNGVLAVTRSLGDSYMKNFVVGKPFTTSTEINSDDEFMILACDGVWDVISDIKACHVVKQSLDEFNDPQLAAKTLCQIAMDNSTTDNITVMVVKFDKSIFQL